MDHSKIFIVLSILVKTINSEKFSYCDHKLFKTDRLGSGRRYFIPLDYKRDLIKDINTVRNNADIPMNYVNWDIGLDKVAIKLLRMITVNRPCNIQLSPCLVRTPLRHDLYVYSDSTSNPKEEYFINFTEIYKLRSKRNFYYIATTAQNITAVGCGVWNVSAACLDVKTAGKHYHIICLFSGIKSILLQTNNSAWTNLYGHNNSIVKENYELINSKLDINLYDVIIMYVLNGLTYSLIIMCYIFLICLKSFHKKLLMADLDDYDEYDDY